MQKNSGISIIVLSQNGSEHLERLFKTFSLNNKYEPFEFIVVDHASEDKTDELIKAWSNNLTIKYLKREMNFSFSQSNNFAESVSSYPYLLFLNNDIVFTNDVLSLSIAQLQDPEIGVVGIRLDDYPGFLAHGQKPTVQHLGIKFSWDEKHKFYRPFQLRLNSIDEAKGVQSGLYPAVTGAFMLCRKSDFRELGGFSESYQYGYEDVDFCLNMRSQLGKVCLCINEMSLQHLEGATRQALDHEKGKRQRLQNISFLKKRINNNFIHGVGVQKKDPDAVSNVLNHFTLNQKDTILLESLKRKNGLKCLVYSHNLDAKEGAPRSLFELVTGLKNTGYLFPIVISPKSGDLREKYNEQDIPTIVSLELTSPFSSNKINLFQLELLRNKLEMFIKEYSIDICIVNTVLGFHIINIAHSTGCSTIWIIRESESPKNHWLKKLEVSLSKVFENTFRIADKIVFVSGKTRELWHSEININTDKSIVINNGLNIDRFSGVFQKSRETIRTRMGIKENQVVFINVGTICDRKNQKQLIYALATLPENIMSRIKVILVGARINNSNATEYFDSLYKEAQNNKMLKERVVFIAETPNIGEYFLASDVYVSTSLVESYPRVIIEAMHFSLPMIVNPVFGIQEQTKEGINALYYDQSDTNSLSEMINNMMNAEIRSKLSKGSEEIYKTLLDYQGMIDSYLDLFSTVSPINQYYSLWIRTVEHMPHEEKIKRVNNLIETNNNTKFSVVVPVYNPDLRIFKKMISSIFNQVYPYWELCIADDASTEGEALDYLEKISKDERVTVHYRKVNGNISSCLNSALELAQQEFFIQVDQDDMLHDTALLFLAEKIKDNPKIDMVYSDEDKIDALGRRYAPYFKTGFNRELLYTHNFMTHFAAYRTSLVRKVGGYLTEYNGSQDLDLNLRVIEESSSERICHISRILYHWRALPGSTALSHKEKPYQGKAGRMAVKHHLERLGVEAKVTTAHKPNYRRVIYKIPSPPPWVTIIIPTMDKVFHLKNCLYSIFEKTTYKNFDIIIANNKSEKKETMDYFNSIKNRRGISIYNYDKDFNFSAINNEMVKYAKGDVLCFLNNDTKIITPDWLESLISYAVQPDVGAVGAKMYYDNNTVQHCGVILGIGNVAKSLYCFLPRKHEGYCGRALLPQEISAVTGACMLIHSKKFHEINGFNEMLAVAYNDIELCLRLKEKGYRNILNPYVELYHFESISRGEPKKEEDLKQAYFEIDYMWKKWGEFLRNDPYANPNLEYEADYKLEKPTVFKLKGLEK